MRKWFFLTFWLLASYLRAIPPDFVYMTWEDDPMTTATIMWGAKEPCKEAVLYKNEKGEPLVADSQFLSEGFFLHALTIKGLQPGTAYRLQVAGEPTYYTFKTMPKKLAEVQFVVGGDAYKHLDIYREMSLQIKNQDPQFVVIGGDLAYTFKNSGTNKEGKLERWKTFFTTWYQATANDGALIPLIAALGNHDVKKTKDKDVIKAEHFYLFFRGNSYKKLDFGDYLTLLILDSGHHCSIQGAQTTWLKNALSSSEKTPYKFAIYHVAAYPSVYSFGGATPSKIRSEWVPLFEKYRVQLAFEHHNHAYKRTKMIKNGKVSSEGVIYLGDGSWGVSARSPNKNLWYIEKSAEKNAVFLITLDQDKGRVRALDSKGEVFDDLTFSR